MIFAVLENDENEWGCCFVLQQPLAVGMRMAALLLNPIFTATNV